MSCKTIGTHTLPQAFMRDARSLATRATVRADIADIAKNPRAIFILIDYVRACMESLERWWGRGAGEGADGVDAGNGGDDGGAIGVDDVRRLRAEIDASLATLEMLASFVHLPIEPRTLIHVDQRATVTPIAASAAEASPFGVPPDEFRACASCSDGNRRLCSGSRVGGSRGPAASGCHLRFTEIVNATPSPGLAETSKFLRADKVKVVSYAARLVRLGALVLPETGSLAAAVRARLERRIKMHATSERAPPITSA